MRRVGLPPGGSILITSAPSPARVSPQYSACSSASSMTRMPVRGPLPGPSRPGPALSCWASMVTFSNLAVGDAGHTCDACLRGQPRRRESGRARRTWLILQLDGHPGSRQGELHALGRRGQLHLDTVLVLEYRHPDAPAHGRAGAGRGVRPGKVLDLLEAGHIAPRTDLGDPEVDDAQALDRERILLTLIFENPVSPAHAHAKRDGLAFEGHLPARSVLCRDRGHPYEEGYQAEANYLEDRRCSVHRESPPRAVRGAFLRCSAPESSGFDPVETRDERIVDWPPPATRRTNPMARFDDYATKYQTIRMERRDGILQMTFHTNGGPLQWGLLPHGEFPQAFRDVGSDPDNKVVILTGTGDVYSGPRAAGGTGMRSTPAQWDRVYWEGKHLLMSLLDIEVPMISAINGPAWRHSEIPLLSDIVLAADDVQFQDSAHFPNGMVPGDGMHIIYPLLLGWNRGRYFLLTGQTIDARRALELGLVSELLPRPDLLPRAWALAEQLAQRPSLLLRYTRVLFTQPLKRQLIDYLGYGLALEGMSVVDRTVTPGT